jgi:DNA-binding NarL/FixJ family response regulator
MAEDGRQGSASLKGPAQVSSEPSSAAVLLACGSEVVAKGLELALAGDERIRVIKGRQAQAFLSGGSVSERCVAVIIDACATVRPAHVAAGAAGRFALLAIVAQPTPLTLSLLDAIGAEALELGISPDELRAKILLAARAKSSLTTRELDVYRELRRCRTDAEVASELDMGVATVRSHARSIFRKLGVSSRAELG